MQPGTSPAMVPGGDFCHLRPLPTTQTASRECRGPLLRQYLGMTAVPWPAALAAVCRRLESGGVDWWLSGSAALAVQGAAVIPA